MDPETVQNKNVELLDFSDEILLKIFTNFSDIDLLNATRVCKRFKAIAKEAYAKRYTGDSDDKYYKISIQFSDGDQVPKLHYQFIQTFGSEITALKITAERRHIWNRLTKLIEKHCRSTKYLILSNFRFTFTLTKMIKSMSALTSLTIKSLECKNLVWAGIHFPHLKHFAIEEITNMDIAPLQLFLQMNPQLDKLRVSNCNKFALSMIQLLKGTFCQLKSLDYITLENDFIDDCPDIEMKQLESLEITVGNTSFQKVLGAIARGSKMIQRLEVVWHDSNEASGIHHQFNETFHLFEGLTSLHLHQFDLTANVIRNLVRTLPKLEELKLNDLKLGELSSDDVLFTFTICKQLKELLWEASKDADRIDVNKFNLEFHREFVNITRSRGGDVKFDLIQSETKMTITAEKIIKNGELFYWTGYEASTSRSKVHFLDLTDDCLEKIYFYLNEDSERALYEICTRTKKGMQQRIKTQEFTVSSANSAIDTFSRFGEHITKLSIDMETNNRLQMTETWKLVSENCSERLTELSFKNIRVNAMTSLQPKFPNLVKLKVMSLVSSRTHIFPPMECPNLTHLEFYNGNVNLPAKPKNIGLSFNHLTTIELNYFSEGIEEILHSLNDNTCDQLQKFTVNISDETQKSYEKMVSIATRFKNLTTLNLTVEQIEMANPKHLFSTCTKLVVLTLGFLHTHDLDLWLKMIQYIKENCKELKVFQLFRNTSVPWGKDVLIEIVDSLPNVKLNLISYDQEWKVYRVDRFRNVTDLDRKKPY